MGLNVSTGPDGISVLGVGWTNQSSTYNTNKSLESYGAASSAIFNPAVKRTYQAWTYDPIFAGGTAQAASTTMAVLIYVTETFSCTSLDYIGVANTTNVTGAIWPSTAPAGTATPLAWSAATANSAAALNSLTWNGASSPSSVTLTGGNFYFATLYSTTVTVAVLNGVSSYIVNAAPAGTYSTSTTYVSGTVGTLTTVSSASVFGTSTLSQYVPWVALH